MKWRNTWRWIGRGFLFGLGVGVGLVASVTLGRLATESISDPGGSPFPVKTRAPFKPEYISVENIRRSTRGDFLVITAELTNTVKHDWPEIEVRAVLRDEGGYLGTCRSFPKGIRAEESRGAEMTCRYIKVENIPESLEVEVQVVHE